jgi:hypothetical protein
MHAVWPCLALPSQRRTGKRPPHRLHARPLPLRCRCCALLRTRALPLLCHRAEPSPPSLPPCVGTHCFYVIHRYKRRPLLHLVRTSAVSTSDKPSPPHPPVFSTAASVPSHLTPPLSHCVGPGGSLSFRTTSRTKKATPSPALSSDAVDHAGEFHPSVARLHRFELGLSTVSGKCTMGWGSLRCTPC